MSDPRSPTLRAMRYPVTPDGRYFVVRGRLWRCTNPALAPADVERFVRELMSARRAVRDAKAGRGDLASARARVEAAKRALGERGPPWWSDGTPDLNRRMAAASVYADWYAALGTTRDESAPRAPRPARRPSSRRGT